MSVLRASATRGVYSRFLARKKVVSLVEQKLVRLGLDFPAIWENVSNALVCPDLRNINWRIVHDVLPVNEKLHRQQSFVSPLCPLCGVGVESLQVIFWGCPVIIHILNRVEVWFGLLGFNPSCALSCATSVGASFMTFCRSTSNCSSNPLVSLTGVRCVPGVGRRRSICSWLVRLFCLCCRWLRAFALMCWVGESSSSPPRRFCLTC